MKKKNYTHPTSETVPLVATSSLMETSRNTEVGTGGSNSDKPHYGDPTGPVSPIEGGESLSKQQGFGSWIED